MWNNYPIIDSYFHLFHFASNQNPIDKNRILHFSCFVLFIDEWISSLGTRRPFEPCSLTNLRHNSGCTSLSNYVATIGASLCFTVWVKGSFYTWRIMVFPFHSVNFSLSVQYEVCSQYFLRVHSFWEYEKLHVHTLLFGIFEIFSTRFSLPCTVLLFNLQSFCFFFRFRFFCHFHFMCTSCQKSYNTILYIFTLYFYLHIFS